MDSDPSFAGWLERLRGGDPEAARRIFHQYAQRLIALARSRLPRGVRGKVDPEDAVQSAFRSFFVRQAQGQFTLRGWNDLWSLLAVITLRKCGHKVEYFRAACRDVAREAPPRWTGDDSVASFALIARDPSPSEAAMMIETVTELMRSLAERDRQVLQMSLQGVNVAKISAHLGCTERTVERALERIRRSLEKKAAT